MVIEVKYENSEATLIEGHLACKVTRTNLYGEAMGTNVY